MAYVRVGLVYKSGVRPSKPFLPFPPTFQANDTFRQWMLTKRTSQCEGILEGGPLTPHPDPLPLLGQ